MADVSNFAPQFKGTRTAIGLATLSGGANDTITAAQLALVIPSSGPLFDFVNATTYANDGAVELAWAQLGGEIVVRGVGVSVSGCAWKTAGAGNKPTLLLTNAAAAGFASLTFRLDHSIIQ